MSGTNPWKSASISRVRSLNHGSLHQVSGSFHPIDGCRLPFDHSKTSVKLCMISRNAGQASRKSGKQFQDLRKAFFLQQLRSFFCVSDMLISSIHGGPYSTYSASLMVGKPISELMAKMLLPACVRVSLNR